MWIVILHHCGNVWVRSNFKSGSMVPVVYSQSQKKKEKKEKLFPHMDLLRSKTRPKTVWSRSNVLQFHRWCLNWCWHSLIHSLVPSPMACMMSGWRWQSCRCLFTRPGILSQITRAPRAPMYLKMPETKKVGLLVCAIQKHSNYMRQQWLVTRYKVYVSNQVDTKWWVAWSRATVKVLCESEFTTLNSLRFCE